MKLSFERLHCRFTPTPCLLIAAGCSAVSPPFSRSIILAWLKWGVFLRWGKWEGVE